MRRLSGLALSGLLSVTLLVLPLATTAVASEPPAVVVLAAEGGEEAPQLGPSPMGPNVDPTRNPAAPRDYEANFLWGAGVGLLALTLFAVAGVAGLYYLLVVRPRQHQSAGT